MSIKRLSSILAVFFIILAMLPPVYAGAETTPPSLISESAVLIDAATGQVLYSKDMHKKQFPASITKIITAAVTLENAELTDTFTMSDTAVNSVGRDTSHIALTSGETISVQDALYAAMLMSANDACNGLAEHVSGSIEKFSELMNEKATEWGAINTHFNNANGLNDEEHYTTAYDMAMIMRHALTIEKFREIIATKTYEMPPNNKQDEIRYFANQHSMIIDPKFAYEGVLGGKNGFTSVAKCTMVTAAQRNGITLIAVVMKSPSNNDRYIDTAALFDYGFDNFSKITYPVSDLASPDTELADANGVTQKLDLKMPYGINVLLHDSLDKSAIKKEILLEGTFDGDWKALLRLKLDDSVSCMYPHIGDFEYETSVTTAKSSPSAPVSGEPSKVMHVLRIIGIIILIPVCAFILLVIVIYIRKQIYYHKKRKRRREQYQRRYKN